MITYYLLYEPSVIISHEPRIVFQTIQTKLCTDTKLRFLRTDSYLRRGRCHVTTSRMNLHAVCFYAHQR